MSETSTPTPTSSSSAGDPGVIARLASQRTQFRTQRDSARTELEQLRTENTRLKGENTNLATRADTSASAKRVQELETQIRDGKHRGAFAKVAKAKGLPEDAVDLVYGASGYKAEGDEPDEAAIGALIDQQRTQPGVSRLFGQGAGTQTPTGTPPVKPGPGSGQGPKVEAPGMIVSQDDPRLSDVKWVMNNYDAVVKQAQDRVARGEV